MGSDGGISSSSFGKEGETVQRVRGEEMKSEFREQLKSKRGLGVQGSRMRKEAVGEAGGCQTWLGPEIPLLFLPRCVLGYRAPSWVTRALILSAVQSEAGAREEAKRQRSYGFNL